MKTIKLSILTLSAFLFFGCDTLQQVANDTASAVLTGSGSSEGIGNVSNSTISNGLKEALEVGVSEGVQKLALQDGYLKNELVKILLPSELKKVDEGLRKIGLGSLADEGLKLLNRAAEDAVAEAKPIFVNAISSMTFADAKNILLGNNSAATDYLQNKTGTQLVNAFQPKIQNSLGKVGADKVWTNIINKYNTFSPNNQINPDLTSYVTEQAVNGLFKMIEEKEKGIRNSTALRTTSLLQEVFALQD